MAQKFTMVSHQTFTQKTQEMQTSSTATYGMDNYITVNVKGDEDKYYAVSIYKDGTMYPGQLLTISRSFNDKAPQSWNNVMSQSKLTLTIYWNNMGSNDSFYGKPSFKVIDFYQNISVVGKIMQNQSSLVVYLRGGDAEYKIHSMSGTRLRYGVSYGGSMVLGGSSLQPLTEPENIQSYIDKVDNCTKYDSQLSGNQIDNTDADTFVYNGYITGAKSQLQGHLWIVQQRWQNPQYRKDINVTRYQIFTQVYQGIVYARVFDGGTKQWSAFGNTTNGIGNVLAKSDAGFSLAAKTLTKCCLLLLTKGVWMVQVAVQFSHSGAAYLRMGVGSNSSSAFPNSRTNYVAGYDPGSNIIALSFSRRFNIQQDTTICMFVDSTINGTLYPTLQATKIANE